MKSKRVRPQTLLTGYIFLKLPKKIPFFPN